MRRVAGALLLSSCVLVSAQALAVDRVSSWATDYGTITLTISDDLKVTGTYPEYDGKILGELREGEITATWIQPLSERRCDRPLLGSFFWGTVQWKLYDNGSMTGIWSFCTAPLGSEGAWNGRMVSGDLPASVAKVPASIAPQLPNRPVTDSDVTAMFERYIGPSQNLAKAQQLTGDFTCDGSPDRVLGYLDEADPAAPEYAVLIVTTSGEQPDGDVERFGFGDVPQPLCGKGPDRKISISRVETTPADAKGFTGADVCSVSVRVSSGQCSDPQVFWKLGTQPGGRPGSRMTIGRN
ncbi:hypothetical protein ACFSM5_06600 [Lacibacterium aquatile]|uniref:Uncharacterized protein n=1 Tax=Lacibacterium aquatile TaxID=1168082 RepID=A0ABW5DSM2_9PROT